MGELTFFLRLQVKQKEDGIFISQEKYVTEILKKFDFMSMKHASTPIKTHNPLVKDEEAADVDVYLYKSMIGSLMYLTASRPDIMFAVCACSRFQLTPKTSHLEAVKRIFRYLKGKPKLGHWYPKESFFDLVAYSDSDYGSANLDRKSTIGGCQFLGHRQVLWIQNQMLDYGFNFMNTKIYIEDESTICIVKNPVFHSKTKHIEIRHHFIRDAYEKKLIQHWNNELLAALFQGRQDELILLSLVNTVGYHFVMLVQKFTLLENPTIYASFIKQFWTTATASTNVNGEVELTASIDGQVKTITEVSLRRHLKLEDNGGITSLPNTEIFEQLALMGYTTDSDKLTFQKVTRGYSGEDTPLFPSMINAPETSPLRITSSPSLSPQHTPVSAPSTSPPPITKTTPTAEEPAPIPHESPLQSVPSLDTASATPEVSTAAKSLVYIRRSAKKKKDKGKAIVIEDEFVQKKSKKQVQEERLGMGSNSFVPMDSEEKVQRLKRAGQDVEAEPAKRQRTEEVSESVQEQTDEDPKTDELSQEQLNQMVIIVPDEGINVEAFQTKYPIIGWEVHSMTLCNFGKSSE
ncbi:hypothetical protein Tco_0852673 [Tanacetum coccineum]